MELFNRLCLTVLYVASTLPLLGCREDGESSPATKQPVPVAPTMANVTEAARDAYERGNVDGASEERARVETVNKRVAETLVNPAWNWTQIEFHKFCMQEKTVSPEGIESLRKAVGLKGPKSGVREQEVKEIQKQVLWISSNILTYPFRDEEKVNYHEVCRWVAAELDVDPWIYKTQPTLILERAICEKLWADIWDKLTLEQRQELIGKLDSEKHLDAAALATMSGTAALAALTGTVSSAGFAFYATMSTTICTVAGWFGVTLPFATYTGSSTIIAFLSGPVGWALIAIGAGVSTALVGRANAQKTAAFIVQVHLLKVAALQESGGTIPDVPKCPS